MFCSNTNPKTAAQPKRSRSDDEAAKLRKANRQEEMLRHMLQPDSIEESNRKDAIFAMNFYEKVEEALLSANRLDDCKKFNSILQNFDPRQEKVSSLYLKVEEILLPNHPDLAEVFLNFLLPAEAAEMGKFFEHFMICNATNFINKLNIYFSKQPAQIRKIYTCLNELAEMPNVSMKKVENKIMPLLKGNQFLVDWFVQQFPQGKPPKRILSPVETINLHDVQNNTTGEYTETIQEFTDVPTPSKPGCHLKYINGRIFYGAKIQLPAKLSFMAASIYNEQSYDAPPVSSDSLNCAHGIRAQGEKLLSMAANTDSDDGADRSEEDDASRALIIDTTGDEQNSCSSIEMCDEAGLRAHAIRLNPGLYSNSSFTNASTSTPNVGNSHQSHHPHAKKTAINFGEISPRKQSAFNNSGLSPLSAATNSSPQVDKRKSPTKKIRSPLNQTQNRQRANNQPMVVIHESQPSSSPAIECAKRLRTLIDQESVRDAADTKAGIRIIAQAKHQPPNQCSSEDITKIEVDSLDESAENMPFRTDLRMDIDQSEEELEPLQLSAGNTPQHVITTQFDSDEDCKLDVVATLANCTTADGRSESASALTASTLHPDSSGSSHSAPWTREEDKVILIEMKIGARDREQLIRRMRAKLKNRSIEELRSRHQFLMDFLSKLQGK
ncbi:GM20022 [Drosophila sechellia]|uniref:GM20022 n=2 Tax=Drosophila sechellia TaxID=7238 RepID=B4HTB7_DROSE|nr:GM20022 [Drosophila sechellia]